MTTQDHELSAALGWPGGTSDPVLDRTQLLQMVAAMRLASQQALEALEWISHCYVGDDDDAGECASCHERSYKPHAPDCKKNNAITALRAALAQKEEPLNLSDPAVQKRLASQWGYVPAAAQAEPVQEPVAKCIDDICSEHLGRVEAFDHLPKGTLLYTIFPRRTMVPLTEEEIYHATGHYGVSEYTAINIARAIEEASWEKNNG